MMKDDGGTPSLKHPPCTFVTKNKEKKSTGIGVEEGE
jgi:hypothetical protein